MNIGSIIGFVMVTVVALSISIAVKGANWQLLLNDMSGFEQAL